jgi:hypothetical protein
MPQNLFSCNTANDNGQSLHCNRGYMGSPNPIIEETEVFRGQFSELTGYKETFCGKT